MVLPPFEIADRRFVSQELLVISTLTARGAIFAHG
jgi:hypothetical protein